jgi:hypothetical protein
MDGLWTAEFGSSAGVYGSGVVVFFQDGRIVGGDSWYFYLGTYQLDGNSLQATIDVSNFVEGVENVFKAMGRRFTLELVGTLGAEGRVIAQGHPRGMPQFRLGVKLTKRS